MQERSKVTLIYTGVAVISVLVLGISFWLRGQKKKVEAAQRPVIAKIEEVGKEEPPVLRILTGDLEATNQMGETVRISELDGKVWVVSQFFANCPICLTHNSQDLIRLYREFGDHPDFHMVSITVDPERDQVDKLKDFAQAVGADSKNWWFLTGEKEALYRYLSEEMKYTPVKENPHLVGAKRFAHDFGVQVYGRERRLVKVRDLVSAKEISPELYEKNYEELRSRIAERLEKPLEIPLN